MYWELRMLVSSVINYRVKSAVRTFSGDDVQKESNNCVKKPACSGIVFKNIFKESKLFDFFA